MRPRTAPDPTKTWAVLVVSLALMTIGITWTYLAMRAVMGVGGACADGGPYVSAQPCPDGAILIAPAVPILMIAAMIGSVAAGHVGAPNLLIPMWAAMFGSLGWNFWEFGLTADTEGRVWGWVVCGLVFWLMAAPAVWFTVTGKEVGRKWWPLYGAVAAVSTVLGVASFNAIA